MYIESKFKPAWWLPGPHLQTLWPTLTRRRVKLPLRRERLELPDKDFIDLEWLEGGKGPIVVLLHGLGGNIESPYATGVIRALSKSGWRALFMHFRGCSGVINRLPRSYHSGDTGDLAYVVNLLKQRHPNVPIAAVGFSLGGNVLLKWLGETGEQNPLACAAAISVPFELSTAAHKIRHGFSRLYQWWMMREMHRHVIRKFSKTDHSIDVDEIKKLNNFWKFDDKITAPLHGFSGAHEYYFKSSAKRFLKHIKVPTLIIHAADDPFMTPDVMPEHHELSESITFELSKYGGHVGFVSGTIPGKAKYWLEERIPEYLKKFLTQ